MSWGERRHTVRVKVQPQTPSTCQSLAYNLAKLRILHQLSFIILCSPIRTSYSMGKSEMNNEARVMLCYSQENSRYLS